MIKLIDLLKEVLDESNIPRLDPDLLKQVDKISNYMYNLYKDEIKDDYFWFNMNKNKRKYKDIGGTEVLDNCFDVTGPNGESKKISVTIHNPSHGLSYYPAGSYEEEDNTITIRIDKLNNINSIKEILIHELIHATDPKITKKISKIVNNDVSKYIKSEHEFDAFSNQIVTTIEDFLESAQDKEKYISLLKSYFSTIPDYSRRYNSKEFISIDTIDKKYKELKTIFGDNFERLFDIMIEWATKPTLYKRFLQRVSRVLK